MKRGVIVEMKLRAKPVPHHLVREDGRLERLCLHGVGHTVGHVDSSQLTDETVWIHGCDRCCEGWQRQS